MRKQIFLIKFGLAAILANSLGFSIPLSFAATENKAKTDAPSQLIPCNQYLKKSADRTGWQNGVVWTFKRQLRGNIRQRCADQLAKGKQCTADDVAYFARESIEVLLKKDRRFRSKMTALGISVVFSYLASLGAEFIPADQEFWRQYVPTLTGLFVYSIGAPFFEPVEADIRQTSFKIGGSRNNKSVQSEDSIDRLEGTWLLGQQSYSNNAQMARNVTHSFRTFVVSAFLPLGSAAPATAAAFDEDLASLLTELLVTRYNNFKEIEPGNFDIRFAIWNALQRRGFFRSGVSGERLEAIKAAAIGQALRWQPGEGDDDERDMQYIYRECLDSWLTIDPPGDR